jgi:hypothetical protein
MDKNIMNLQFILVEREMVAIKWHEGTNQNPSF